MGYDVLMKTLDRFHTDHLTESCQFTTAGEFGCSIFNIAGLMLTVPHFVWAYLIQHKLAERRSLSDQRAIDPATFWSYSINAAGDSGKVE